MPQLFTALNLQLHQALLGSIACTQYIRCGLLLLMLQVAQSVCMSLLGTWVSCGKRLNRSRCRLGANSCGSREPCITWRSRLYESIRCRKGWRRWQCGLLPNYFKHLFTTTYSHSDFTLYPLHFCFIAYYWTINLTGNKAARTVTSKFTGRHQLLQSLSTDANWTMGHFIFR